MSEPQPTLRTERLTLRPVEPGDAADIERHVGMREIADTTLTIPHPYPPGSASEWVRKQGDWWKAGSKATFAIVETASAELVGSIGLVITPEHRRAELGYWIGVSRWNRGYATEASSAMLAFGFEELRLHRIEAQHFLRNSASGQVMKKLGMRFEGHARDAVIRWDRFETLAVYAILEPEWRAGAEDPSRPVRSP